MSVEVTEKSRSLWRRELAAQALWELQGPLRIVPQAHGEEDDKYNFMGALHSMISDGYWNLDQLLEDADRYLELIGSPESEWISAELRRSVDALRSGEEPSEYIFGDLEALSKQNREHLSSLDSGIAKARGFLLAQLDLAYIDADASSCKRYAFCRTK